MLWMMNASLPRRLSSISTLVSPSENLLASVLHKSTPSCAAMSFPREGLALPQISLRFSKDSGMGLALQDNEGFVKIFADKKTRKILGCHILGTDASTLIHEVVVAMKADLKVDAIREAVHVHPALSEVVQRAVNNIEW